MKNSILILLVLFFTSNVLLSQDIIHLKDNSQVKALVKSVDKNNITYVRADNPEGPVYEISRKKISKVVYTDGFIESYAGSELLFNDNKNVISVNYGDLTLLRFAGSYERLFSEGFFGVKIPYSIAFAEFGYGGTRVLGQSGMDLNLYPLGQRKVAYFTGIGTRMGLLAADYYYPYYEPFYDPYLSSYYERRERLFFGIYVNNGIVVNITDKFSVSGQFGIGFRNEEGLGRTYSHGNGELNVSLRF